MIASAIIANRSLTCMLLKTVLNFFLLLEEITNTPFCMYIFRLARAGLDLLSQTSDMNIDGSDISRIIIPPHQIQKILSVENLVRIRDQKFQQITSRSPIKTLLLSRSMRISPETMVRSAGCSCFLPFVRRMIALIRALISRILKGFVT